MFWQALVCLCIHHLTKFCILCPGEPPRGGGGRGDDPGPEVREDGGHHLPPRALGGGFTLPKF